MSSIAQSARIPAWPTLLGVQALVVLALAAVVVQQHQAKTPASPPIGARLQAMDIPVATSAVRYALEHARNDAAVMAEDEIRVTSFLALAARGAGLEVSDIRLLALEQREAPGIQVVEATLDVAGHLYDLPIFLDGAHRQRAVGRLQSMAFDVQPGGEMHGQVRLLFHRPQPMDTEWIADRLVLAAPGAAEAAPLLEQAAHLAAWRAFSRTQPGRAEHARLARSRAAKELPANLIAIQDAGGRFVWDADEGIVIR